MVRLYEIPASFDASACVGSLLAHLPQWRLRKAMSYRRDIDKFLSAKSFLLLEEMLRERFGLDHCPEFSYMEKGKPYLEEYPGIHFNISHCPRAVACAVSDHPVGIDVEVIQQAGAVAGFVLNRDELSAVNRSEHPDVDFTVLWTRKECVLKLSGEGISDNVRDILSVINQELIRTAVRADSGYVLSVASESQHMTCRNQCDENLCLY